MAKIPDEKKVNKQEDFDFTDPFSELGITVNKSIELDVIIGPEQESVATPVEQEVSWNEEPVKAKLVESKDEITVNNKITSPFLVRFVWFSVLFLLTSFLIYNLVEFKKERDVSRDSKIYGVVEPAKATSSSSITSTSSKISSSATSSIISVQTSSAVSSVTVPEFKYENKIFKVVLGSNPPVVLSSLEAPFTASFLSDYTTTITSLIGIDNLTSQKVGVELIPVEVGKFPFSAVEANLTKALGDGYKKNQDFTNSKNISFVVYNPTKLGQNPAFYLTKTANFTYIIRVWSIPTTDLDQQIVSVIEFK